MSQPREEFNPSPEEMDRYGRTTYGAEIIEMDGIQSHLEEDGAQSNEEQIQEGDWVEIREKGIAQFFYQGKAKVVLLLKGIVDQQGNPVIIPGPKAPVREKTSYEVQLSRGVREQTRAVLFGLTSDQTRRAEYQKPVPLELLKKTEEPTKDLHIKKTTQKKKGEAKEEEQHEQIFKKRKFNRRPNSLRRKI